MRSRRAITVVGCHAGGEVGNVVVGGVLPPPGDTVFEQMQALRADDSLRRLLLREPRGSVAVHANLIVSSQRPECAAGYIIMEPTEYPAMSGSNTMCVATVLLETGMVEMHEPETTLRLEAPAGVVEIRAACRDGRCESVEITNVPCFADRLDAPLEVDGLGTLIVDVAFGGMWYAIADAAALGFALEPSEARELCARRRAHSRRGARAAAVRAPGESRHRRGEHRADCGAVAGSGGRRRRTPSSSPRAGSTAPRRAPASRRVWRRCTRAALMHVGDAMTHASVIGTTFDGRIVAERDRRRPAGDRAGDPRQRLDHGDHRGDAGPDRPVPGGLSRSPTRGPGQTRRSDAVRSRRHPRKRETR